MTDRFLTALILGFAACIAAVALLAPLAEAGDNTAPVEDEGPAVPQHPCPAGSQANGPYLPAECVCPGGAVAAMIAADGQVTPVAPCTQVGPATTTSQPECLECVGYDGQAYPLDPPPGPVQARPAVTG